ncbi:hypothetical protein [Desulfogranum marinum]|uniref:hypothetical protein n=1 Tax=Desulfogranum marinum TaxID=453220 RepID=UPI001962EEF4|nr:hypothetical protein [Desulfogranum marinum]MBM9512262.1 hypothetical protein [Desulfogranum marinum]
MPQLCRVDKRSASTTPRNRIQRGCATLIHPTLETDRWRKLDANERLLCFF